MAPVHRSRGAALAAGALALVLALTGCASGGDAGGEGAGGGTLTFAIGNDPLNFSPSAKGGNGNDTWYVTRQLYDSLVYYNPETKEAEPWLAESFEVNEDATQYTFTLRDDVTFSDGTKLTANTVKLNFDDIKAAGAESSAVAYLATYEGTEVRDDRTAVVTFSTPNAAFLAQASTATLGLVSDASIEVPFGERSGGTNISGSGPFVLESYTKDQSTKLTKRAEYAWAPAAFGNTGAASLDAVEFNLIPEAGNRTGGLTSGQIDVAGGIAPNDIETVQASAEIVERPNPGTVFGVYFNEKNPIIADEAVREAVAYAVDPQQIRDGALNDHFAVATGVLSQSTSDYADLSATLPKTDTAKAESLLDAAGWTKGADGIREKDGQKLTFRITYINNFGPNADSIALLQQQLQAVGIGSEQISGTVPEFQESITSGEYEIAWRNLSSVDADVLRLDFSDVGTTNWPVSDPALNQQLIDQATIGDPAARTAELKTIQEELIAGHHFVPVHELTTVVGVGSGVTGIQLGADSRLDLLVNVKKG